MVCVYTRLYREVKDKLRPRGTPRHIDESSWKVGDRRGWCPRTCTQASAFLPVSRPRVDLHGYEVRRDWLSSLFRPNSSLFFFPPPVDHHFRQFLKFNCFVHYFIRHLFFPSVLSYFPRPAYTSESSRGVDGFEVGRAHRDGTIIAVQRQPDKPILYVSRGIRY